MGNVRSYIVISDSVRGGKPCITGTRITVSDIVILHLRLGKPLDEIAGTYDLTLAGVYAAMSYYYDNKNEVDESIDREIAFAEAFERSNPSLLRERSDLLGSAE